jgi:polyphosphate glucokinase
VKAKSRHSAKPRTGRRKRARAAKTPSAKKVLAVGVCGSSVKILATGQTERRLFPAGPTLTPRRMVSGVRKLAHGWTYDVVSIGYPGPALRDRPMAEPYNLGRGWAEPMELGHLPYRKDTYEDYVGRAGLQRGRNGAGTC